MDNCHSTVTAKDMGDVAICIFTQIVKQANIFKKWILIFSLFTYPVQVRQKNVGTLIYLLELLCLNSLWFLQDKKYIDNRTRENI